MRDGYRYHIPAEAISEVSIRKPHFPGTWKLEVVATLMIVDVRDPGTLKKLLRSPALNPTWAGIPPRPPKNHLRNKKILGAIYQNHQKHLQLSIGYLHRDRGKRRRLGLDRS